MTEIWQKLITFFFQIIVGSYGGYGKLFLKIYYYKKSLKIYYEKFDWIHKFSRPSNLKKISQKA